MPTDDHRLGAPEPEIEITPEMIEAGQEAYYAQDHYPGDYGIRESDVAAIYRAMRAKEAAASRSSS